MFSTIPHDSDEACHARLTQIDPIQAWINAERRSMEETQQKHKSRGIVIPRLLHLKRYDDVSANVRR
jgi:hypothetical protein